MSDQISPEDRARLTRLSKECAAACAGDNKAAAELLFNRLKDDAALYAAVADPLLKAHCWRLTANVRRNDRIAVWTAPGYQDGLDKAASNVRHLASANRTLMEGFAMPDGSRLGDATHTKLVEAAKAYTTQAIDMRNKGRFLAMLATRVRGEKRVRDVLKEADLIDLRDRASKKDVAA